MNVYIGWAKDYSAMQWPAPDGFHVPLDTERQAVYNIWTTLWGDSSDWANFWIALKMPFAGSRSNADASADYQGSNGYYWSSSSYNANNAYYLFFFSFAIDSQDDYLAQGFSVRCFKDIPVIPTSSWTKLYWTSIEAGGIFWSSADWLISLSSDWQTWITIADKNLWATTVWNSWDTLSEANCGKYYQWGNNYWFTWTWSITTSSTKVDASNYWPWNYYSSSTFINSGGGWSSVQNDNLWWWVTGLKPASLKNIYIGEKTVYEWEYIEYKMNADSNGILCVPLSWLNTSWSRSCPYNWKVSVDWGSETIYSWTGGSWWYISLSWYTSWSNHTIMIKPVTEDYQRARAYNWYDVSLAGNITEIVYDSSYMWYWVSATDTGDYFRAYQYQICSALTNTENEYLPDTVVTIWNYFRSWQYSRCTSLKYAWEESLPNSVTSIWSGFRYWQYAYCSALTEIKWWKDLSIGNSSYRENQYNQCTSNKTVKVLSDVGYNSYSQRTLQDAYVTSVSVPSAYLNNFKNTSNYPWVWITDSKFIWY